jgi:hypothetical protein
LDARNSTPEAPLRKLTFVWSRQSHFGHFCAVFPSVELPFR